MTSCRRARERPLRNSRRCLGTTLGLLRFLLALSVLVGHVHGLPGLMLNGQTPYLLRGDAAVQSFYVISGFYMALVLDRVYANSARNPLSFWLSRYLRLAPLYILISDLTAATSSRHEQGRTLFRGQRVRRGGAARQPHHARPGRLRFLRLRHQEPGIPVPSRYPARRPRARGRARGARLGLAHDWAGLVDRRRALVLSARAVHRDAAHRNHPCHYRREPRRPHRLGARVRDGASIPGRTGFSRAS